MQWLNETCCQESNTLSLSVLTLHFKLKMNSFYSFSIAQEGI